MGALSLEMRRPPVAIQVAGGLILAYEWALLVSTIFAPGSIGLNYLGVGADWMPVHHAAGLLLRGDLSGLYDGEAFTAALNAKYAAHLSGPLAYRPWVNPPWFLLLVAPFGLLGFVAALVVSLLVQAFIWARMVYVQLQSGLGKSVGKLAIALCLLSPASAFNALSGQTAPFACVLMLCTLCWSRTRPALAGAALALLTYKPQYGIAITVFLVASRDFRTLAWASALGGGLILASSAILGIHPWLDWVNLMVTGLAGSGSWNDAGRLWGNSVYACLVSAGLTPAVATVAQAIATMGAIAGAIAIAWRDTCRPRQIASIMLLTLLAAPYYSGYDTVLAVTALIIVYINAPDLAPRSVWGWTIPLLVWAIPFYSPPIVNPAGRLTPLILLAAILQLYMRRHETGVPQDTVCARSPTASTSAPRA